MLFKIFQITFSRQEQIFAANRNDPKNKAYDKAAFDGRFPGREFYSHVADIDGSDLDHVFEIGNVGPECAIIRHAPMHSLSVGDVVVNEEGEAFFVARVGFDAILRGWE